MCGQERTDELVACAEEEGQLNVYTSNTDMEDLIDVFSDEYDIEVNNYRAGSESVLQRLLQEDEAGYYGADVFETNALELGVAEQEGLLYPYEGELRDSVLEQGRQSEGWTATRFNAFVVGWNTDKVKPGEEPKTLEELAEPQWKGRISMEVGDVDWFTALHDYYVEEQGMSEEEYTDFMTRLASNSQVVKGHTVQGELLSAGQFDVGVSLYSHTVDKAADERRAGRLDPGRAVSPCSRSSPAPTASGWSRPPPTRAPRCSSSTSSSPAARTCSRRPSASARSRATDNPLSAYETYPVPEEKLLEDPDTWNKAYEDVVANGQAID